MLNFYYAPSCYPLMPNLISQAYTFCIPNHRTNTDINAHHL